MAEKRVDPRAKPRRRWWRWVAAVVVVVLAVGVAALPWLLGTAPARRWLLARANATLAPARLEVKAFGFSWLGATRMKGFQIFDHHGDRVVDAPVAVWDRNLWQALFDRPRYGRLSLPGGRLDVEREPDGTIDLYEALRPILTGRPETQFRVQVTGGTLRLRSDGLAGPLRGQIRELIVNRPSAPRPVTWSLELEQAQNGRQAAGRLRSTGAYDRWKHEPGGGHPLAFSLYGARWPFAVEAAGVNLNGTLEGVLGFTRQNGAWRLTGQTEIGDGVVGGPRLEGDRLDLGGAKGSWDVSHDEDGWRVARLDLASPLGTLRASGPLPAPRGRATRIEGRLDLAALVGQIPHALRLREGLSLDRGEVRLTVESAEDAGKPAWDVSARVSDLVATLRERRIHVEQPATLSAHLVDDGGLSVAWLELESAFVRARGSGDMNRGVNITGIIDLAELKKQARDLIDLRGIDLAGRGTIAGDYRRSGGSFVGHLTLELSDLALGRSGSGGLHADEARLVASLEGPADDAGAPAGWERGRLAWRSNDLVADAVAFADANRLARVAASVDAGVTLRGRPGRAVARVVARREGDGWAIDEAAVVLDALRAEAEGTAEVLMSGHFDANAGELTLRSAGASSGGAIGLGPEGLSVAGLGGSEWRAKGRLVGEAGVLGRFVATWSGRPDPELDGSWSVRADAWSGEGEAVRFAGKVELPDLTWPTSDGERRGLGPMALDLAGSYREASDELSFTELVGSGRFATIEAAGRVVEPAGARVVDLRGTVTPDWEALTQWLVANVEPGARVAGGSRPFRLTGPLSLEREDPLAGIDAEAGFALEELDVFGMRLGATPVVVRVEQGTVSVDPIRTTLNGGRLRLDPRLDRGEDDSWTLRLEPGSALVDAEVNDEVSRRVLSYAAPVLDRATRVRGRVSAEIDRAEFPLGPGFGRKTVVEGRVVFQDVAFAPGPLATTLVGLIGAEAATMRLDEPVVLSIAEGRVRQSGLALPLGRLTRIELKGAVGFDRSLDLVASLPITRAMVANNDLLGDVVEGTRISVPIGGTLENPQIDREAFRTAMNDLGKTLLRRGVARARRS